MNASDFCNWMNEIVCLCSMCCTLHYPFGSEILVNGFCDTHRTSTGKIVIFFDDLIVLLLKRLMRIKYRPITPVCCTRFNVRLFITFLSCSHGVSAVHECRITGKLYLLLDGLLFSVHCVGIPWPLYVVSVFLCFFIFFSSIFLAHIFRRWSDERAREKHKL